ncbi:MAG: hypothetical protein K9N51_06915 [Candidatus Pacebacteria bacterium]|nr:hypothetical protein [Candidatus Paceibacterota bacterium]
MPNARCDTADVSEPDRIEYTIGPWHVECLPADGGRISRLCVAGKDLLTGPPAAFRPPVADYGAYELRPVYGYDDCLPSVDPCVYPGTDWDIPDHGELCWLPWTAERTASGLVCRTASRRLPLTFERNLVFAENTLTWEFSARNAGEVPLVFLHVMHALMPLNHVTRIVLPTFGLCMDEETSDVQHALASPADVARELLTNAARSVRMLLLRKTDNGRFLVELGSEITVEVRYDSDLFPTLGIWWNRDGYPDEDGIRRNECAFEPIPGSGSVLSGKNVSGLFVKPGRTMHWSVIWEVAER